LIARRKQAEAAHGKKSLQAQMYKLVANSFYGKLAQGVKYRVTRSPGREAEPLPESKVSSPHYAAYCTALVRNAIVYLTRSLELLGCVVLNATTDGIQVAVPRRAVTGPLAKDPKNPAGDECDFAKVAPELFAQATSHWTFDLLRGGREQLGRSDLIEVKHWGDMSLTIKTRGNVLWCGDNVVKAAKAGLKFDRDQFDSAVETDDDVGDHLVSLTESESIVSLTFKRLPSLGELYDLRTHAGDLLIDYVMIEEARRSNLDWDWKRRPESAAGGATVPHRRVEDMLAARRRVQAIRDRGERATIERVLREAPPGPAQSKQKIQRRFLTAVAHGLYGSVDDSIAKMFPTIPYELLKRRSIDTAALIPDEASVTYVQQLERECSMLPTVPGRRALFGSRTIGDWVQARVVKDPCSTLTLRALVDDCELYTGVNFSVKAVGESVRGAFPDVLTRRVGQRKETALEGVAIIRETPGTHEGHEALTGPGAAHGVHLKPAKSPKRHE
jgi:hypothetical protein